MGGCGGCTCSSPTGCGAGSRLLLASRVGHTVGALRALAKSSGLTTTAPAPGLLDLTGEDLAGFLTAARAALSAPEAEEVRAALVGDERDADLLAAALAAPTLAQLGARVEHADLAPLFSDELRSFSSVYQPIVDLATGAVVGHEALLRATGPRGPLLPGPMFAAAAEAGWMHVLDRVGRTTALRGATGWLGDDLLFVNFAPTTIYRPQVCLRTTELAASRAGLRLDQLVFEVTEGERIADLDHLADVFAYYRERGCRVALDDLGSGYSSLNALVRLQPDVVKLDKEIVQGLPGANSRAVVTAVRDMTRAYGGRVLAECVETEAQAEAARELGVDLGQGWLFGRPVPRGPVPAPTRQEPRGGARPSVREHGIDPAVAVGGSPPVPAAERDRLAGQLQEPLAVSRAAGTALAVLAVRLGALGSIREEHGADVAELVASAVAFRLSGRLRRSDVLVRLGDDVFLALVAGSHPADLAPVSARVARDVAATFAAPLDVPGLALTPGAQVGVAPLPGADYDVEGVLAAAGRALRDSEPAGATSVVLDPSTSGR